MTTVGRSRFPALDGGGGGGGRCLHLPAGVYGYAAVENRTRGRSSVPVLQTAPIGGRQAPALQTGNFQHPAGGGVSVPRRGRGPARHRGVGCMKTPVRNGGSAGCELWFAGGAACAAAGLRQERLQRRLAKAYAPTDRGPAYVTAGSTMEGRPAAVTDTYEPGSASGITAPSTGSPALRRRGSWP